MQVSPPEAGTTTPSVGESRHYANTVVPVGATQISSTCTVEGIELDAAAVLIANVEALLDGLAT